MPAGSQQDIAAVGNGAVHNRLQSLPAAVSDDELSGMRGGFFTAGGAQFDFGASIQTLVNGQLALQTSLQWTPAGALVQQLSGLGDSIAQQVAADLTKAGISVNGNTAPAAAASPAPAVASSNAGVQSIAPAITSSATAPVAAAAADTGPAAAVAAPAAPAPSVATAVPDTAANMGNGVVAVPNAAPVLLASASDTSTNSPPAPGSTAAAIVTPALAETTASIAGSSTPSTDVALADVSPRLVAPATANDVATSNMAPTVSPIAATTPGPPAVPENAVAANVEPALPAAAVASVAAPIPAIAAPTITIPDSSAALVPGSVAPAVPPPVILTGIQIQSPTGGSTQIFANVSGGQLQNIILNSASDQSITQNTNISLTIYNFQAWQMALAQRALAAQLGTEMAVSHLGGH